MCNDLTICEYRNNLLNYKPGSFGVVILFVSVFIFPHQQRVCEREESKGRRLLTTLAGLFVSNSDDDIKIAITALEEGWKIIGSHLMVGKKLMHIIITYTSLRGSAMGCAMMQYY